MYTYDKYNHSINIIIIIDVFGQRFNTSLFHMKRIHHYIDIYIVNLHVQYCTLYHYIIITIHHKIIGTPFMYSNIDSTTCLLLFPTFKSRYVRKKEKKKKRRK